MNLETGGIERISVGRPDTFAYSVCSPWRDGLGRMHLVAQWRGYDENGGWAAGLARYALPGGEVLDRVTLDVPSTGPPCWSPDLLATILFAGTDGRLYCLGFSHQGDFRRPGGHVPAPHPLAWKNPLRGATVVRILDPTWPTDPRLGRTLLVSMAVREDEDAVGRANPELPQLWWLRLCADGLAIESAGRLVQPSLEHSALPIQEERMARISTTPDGGLVLAFLVRHVGRTDLQLRLATVAHDEETGTLQVDGSEVVALAEGLACSPPVFSEDGRWVYATVKRGLEEVQAETPVRVKRYSVGDALRKPSITGRPCTFLGFAPREWEPSHVDGNRGCEACGEAELPLQWRTCPASTPPLSKRG
ncbi:hypothetical protein [Singulisphaera sp. GP187]|uniref:hypothetical protein n=1 Tax=Singulisphaera sp. GP187 TaxID=1882752 RepID=UPI0020B12CFD|nr:hypothetical protein [Singulisphaera sp. GP187]